METLNIHKSISKIIKRFLVGVTAIFAGILSSCISTVGDVIGQYDFQGPIDFAQWYADDFSNDSLWNKAIKDSLLPRIMDLPFDDIAQIGFIVKDTPAFTYLSTMPNDKAKIMASFKKRGLNDGIDFYLKYHNLFSDIHSVFVDSVLPVIDKAPYPVLSDINSKLKKANVKVISDSLLLVSKDEYLMDVKEEIEDCKKRSMEAFDQAVLPAIEFELDSLSEKNIRTVIDKFSGGFLDYRRLLVAFGRDEKKFKELWIENINSNDYTEIYFRHISTMLKDMYNLQNEYYRAYTDESDVKLKIKMIEPAPIKINFPEAEMDHINEFIENEKLWGTIDAANMLPNLPSADPKILALQTIFETGRFIVDIWSSVASEELSPEDKLLAYCQYAILSQIPESYKDGLRSKVLSVIDESYNNLYINISNAI